jgi:hypothetical protein
MEHVGTAALDFAHVERALCPLLLTLILTVCSTVEERRFSAA